jgi:hypothetical protein
MSRMRLEVDITTNDKSLRAELAEIDKLPPIERLEATGELLVYIGVMWQKNAARIRGRSSAFSHNKRKAKP